MAKVRAALFHAEVAETRNPSILLLRADPSSRIGLSSDLTAVIPESKTLRITDLEWRSAMRTDRIEGDLIIAVP